jgi:hypothetical protein
MDAAARATWRKRALGWLHDDLAFWTRSAGSNAARPIVRARLAQWQYDPDLASVRDIAAIAALPESEQQPFRDLWREVADVIGKIPDTAQHE